MPMYRMYLETNKQNKRHYSIRRNSITEFHTAVTILTAAFITNKRKNTLRPYIQLLQVLHMHWPSDTQQFTKNFTCKITVQ